MAGDKLLAEWFWTDRWMGSSAFLLPMLARGVYREMLTQAWRRGARLPNDHASIKRAIGATDQEWAEAWPQVSKYWRVDDTNHLVNDTQLSIYAESQESANATHERAIKAAQARWKQNTSNAQASAQAQLAECPPSPSPSPSPSLISGSVSISKSVTNNKLDRKPDAVTKANGNGHNARSKHPIFSGQRFVVFDWMLEDIGRTLGSHLEAFDVHEWFFSLDARAVKDSIVKPKNDWWPWIQQELITEAQKRGLPTSEPKKFGITQKTSGNAAALKRFSERKTS